MTEKYHLISSLTCPWVQRSVIVMRLKGVEYKVTYIDLRDKPDWFLKISPHGKVPVLLVDGEPLFESNAIAEYLDETIAPRLHPEDPIKRARNRAWTDFVPDFASALRGVTYAKSREELDEGVKAAPARLARLEAALGGERGNDGPYFNGDRPCLVDCAYAPFLQRLAFVEKYLETVLLDGFPLVQGWSDALLGTEAVSGAVAANFAEAFEANLRRRGAYVATLMAASEAAE